MRYSTLRSATVVFVTVMAWTPIAIAARGARSALPQTPPAKTTTWAAPRTPWGEPDLQGVFTNQDELNIPIERPERFEGRKLEDVTLAELAEFAQESNGARRRTFEQNNGFAGLTAIRFDQKPSRAWLIVDPTNGKIPELTEEGRRRQLAYVARQLQPPNSAEDLTASDRCISLGLPGAMMPSPVSQPSRIVQAPGLVMITYEVIHEARVIPLDGRPHVGRSIRMYMGDARGRWENNTLVVETTNLKGDFRMTSAASKDLRIVERFKPAGPGTLEWSVTFDDPSAWARPWTIAMRLTKTDESQHALEYACHEGNYALRNILSGARATERDAR